MNRIARLVLLGFALSILAACGGHGGSSSGSATSAPTPTPAPAPTVAALSNFAALTVDAGPAALAVGPNGYISDNLAYVSVTLCAPGTSTCQTIDHVQVDTGSVGLRVVQSVLTPALLAALPHEKDATGNQLGECYQYVDGYAFGSVRQADFQIGGESVSGMPFQVINDGGAFSGPPSTCSAGGGANLNSVQALGANGIIGLGPMTTDCDAVCATPGGYGPAIYYDCPSSGCGAIVTEAASTTAPFQQLPNPVAAMPVDNNGTIVSLPAAPAGASTSLTGTIYFGIGTQANNGLGSATVLATTSSASPLGVGFITATYNGQSLPESYVDSGSSLYLFVDASLPLCTGSDFTGYYCPPTPIQVSPSIATANGGFVSAAFTLDNAQTLLSTNGASVLPGVGANPSVQGITNAYPRSFDFGLPFFYGRNVYTALEGRPAGGATGPYVAY